MNRPDDSIKVLERLQTDPRISNAATVRLAALKFNAGARTDANTLVDSVLARDPGNPIALVTKAQMLLSANQLDDALARATAAARSDRRNALALFVIGNIQSARNDVSHAIAAYNDVLKLNPRAVPAYVRIASLLVARRDFNGARAAVVSGLALQPENLRLRLMLVRVHMGSNRLDDAEHELEALNKLYPASASVQALTGQLRAAMRDTTGARQAYDRALILEPLNWDAFEGLVILRVQSGQPDEARRLLEARLVKMPADSAALVLMARTYFAIGALDRAEPYLKKAIDAEPGNLTAYELLGALYLETHRLDEARIQYEAAVKRAPRMVPANLMLGVVLEAQHKTDEAMRQYERVLELDPKSVVANNNLAWLHIQRDDNIDVALAFALAAKQARPADATVNDTLGWIYYKKNLANDAVRLLQQAIQAESKNPLHYYHLGMAYLKRGDDEEARAALEHALGLDPKFSEASAARMALAAM
jgi:tetratricopeptide (TPR) repeat protein